MVAAKSREGVLADRKLRGFTYLGVLIAIAVLGVLLLAISEIWVASVRRSKTVELEWIGSQFIKAIGSYYQAAPGGATVYPSTFADLIDDRRYATIRRHLRELYANPFTGKPDWQLVVAVDGRMRGVRAVVPGENGDKPKEFVYFPAEL